MPPAHPPDVKLVALIDQIIETEVDVAVHCLTREEDVHIPLAVQDHWEHVLHHSLIADCSREARCHPLLPAFIERQLQTRLDTLITSYLHPHAPAHVPDQSYPKPLFIQCFAPMYAFLRKPQHRRDLF